jgi:phage tail-like protein
MSTNDPTFDSVLTAYFKLEIDTYDLGVFTSCSGLGMEMSVEQYDEGGGGMFTYQLMGNFKYTNLQVSRPIGPWTANTMTWLNMMAQAGAQGVQPTTARLSALDPSGDIVFAWSLQGVIPARWTGPSFDVNNLQQATETLELAYTAIMLDPSDTSDDLFSDALP